MACEQIQPLVAAARAVNSAAVRLSEEGLKTTDIEICIDQLLSQAAEPILIAANQLRRKMRSGLRRI